MNKKPRQVEALVIKKDKFDQLVRFAEMTANELATLASDMAEDIHHQAYGDVDDSGEAFESPILAQGSINITDNHELNISDVALAVTEMPTAALYEPGTEPTLIYGELHDKPSVNHGKIRIMPFGKHGLKIRFLPESVTLWDGNYYLTGSAVIYAPPVDGVMKNLTLSDIYEIGSVIAKKEEVIQMDGEIEKGFYIC